MGIDDISSRSTSASSGRSPDANKIYDEYIRIDTLINREIDRLNREIYDLSIRRDGKNHDQEKRELQQRIDDLNVLQGRKGSDPTSLLQFYQAAYGNSSVSIDDFKALCEQIMARAKEISEGNTGIRKEYDDSNRIIKDLDTKIATDQKALDTLKKQIADWMNQINVLRAKLSSNSPELLEAERQLQNLISAADVLENKLGDLQGILQLAKVQLANLEALMRHQPPSKEDIADAKRILESIKGLDDQFFTKEKEFKDLSPNASSLAAMNAAIEACNQNSNPYQKDIQANYDAAKKIIDELTSRLAKDQAALNDLKKQIEAWQKELDALEAEVNKSDNQKAKDDFAAAKKQLELLKASASAIQSEIDKLKPTLDQASTNLSALNDLLKKQTNSLADKDAAAVLLANVSGLKNTFNTSETIISQAIALFDTKSMTNAITAIKLELNTKSSIEKQLQDWINKYVVAWTENGKLCIRINWDNTGGPDGMKTCSESIAYAMRLLTDNPSLAFTISIDGKNTSASSQAVFDGLYSYAVSKFDDKGLMEWEINQNGNVIGSGSASDADSDMALALIQAHKAWGDTSGRYNYGAEAQKMLDNIRKYDCYTDSGGKPPHSWSGPMFGPGDNWYDSARENFNPSYVDPNAWAVFAEFDKNSPKDFWKQLTQNCLTVIAGSADPNTGLIPDWCNPKTYGRASEFPNSLKYSYDACRVPYRLSLYLANVSSTDAIAGQITSILSNLMDFTLEHGGMPDGGYNLNGSPLGDEIFHSPTFDGPIATALSILLSKGLYPPLDSPHTYREAYQFTRDLHQGIVDYLENIPSPYEQNGSTPYYDSVIGLLTSEDYKDPPPPR